MNLSEKILRLRTARRMSQGDLAEQLGVSRQSVSKWETGQSIPDLDKIIKLADLFGVTTDYLVREQENETSGPAPSGPVAQIGMKKLRVSQVCGIVMALLGLLLTALVAVSASRGQIGHIELVFVLLLVLPGAVLALAPKHNLLAMAWTLWSGSFVICMLGDTRLLMWLKKFYLMFFLGEMSSSTSISVMGGLKTGLFWLRVLLLCLLAVRTWETRKKEHGETGRDG